VKDGPLHENVEEERDLRIGPVRVPVPLVRPTLYSKSEIKRKDYRGGNFKEIKLSRGTKADSTEIDEILGVSPLKGTVPRDFRLLFFFMNQFPPSP
jgi:hypothetical protein